MRIVSRALVVFVLLVLTRTIHAALTADNLLLVVNKNVPQGRKLADYYAQQRHVPAGRTIAVDVGAGDDIAPDDFDQKIAAPIRDFLTNKHLRERVTCIVTFYGVPLRIPLRAATPELRRELVSIRKQLAETTKQAQTKLDLLEKLALQVDPSFKPVAAPRGERVDPVELLPTRADHAASVIVGKLQTMPPGAERAALEEEFKALSQSFRGPVHLSEPSSAPTTREGLTQQQLTDRLSALAEHRGDPAARGKLRDFAREHAGIILFLQILNAQEQYLTPEDSDAAVDNELAALWWGLYPRSRWQVNPLNYKYPIRGRQTVMVMRLDGADADQVHAMIDTSIKIENEGLKGKIVLDSRGLLPEARSGKADPYGAYDQTIRDLAALIRNHTKLDLLADDNPALLPPGSAKDVAIYCGWYSPGKYVPSVSLAPGAVAVHIASYEMTTLHNPTTGWCRNLLNAGAVATFGPVAEPYLHSFPTANEFFGVLLTGKLTLAETFWVTNPLVSWKICMVGDPLYVPFKNNPALKSEDLPASMQRIFTHDVTEPMDR